MLIWEAGVMHGNSDVNSIDDVTKSSSISVGKLIAIIGVRDEA